MQQPPRAQTRWWVTVIAIVLPILVGTLLYVIGVVPPPVTGPKLALVAGIGAALAFAVGALQEFATRPQAADAQWQTRRKATIADLAQTHRELVDFLDVLEGDLLQQQADASRQAFWQGAVQNFIFYALGVFTPGILTRLHA
jgi:hypothetical protein